MTADWLRRKLRPFDARPTKHYVDGKRQRGYATAPLREAIARYITPSLPTPGKVGQASQVGREPASGASVGRESAERDTWDAWDTFPGGAGEGGIE